ncbi:MAG: hypothetical protein ABI759_01160 [Candidatus Solibacter sp.]
MKTDNRLAVTRTAEHQHLHIARREMATSSVASPTHGDRDSATSRARSSLHSGARPFRSVLPDATRPCEPLPIWLSVLMATACEAQRNGVNHAVKWSMVAGRAVYTNAGRDDEHIEPLGVSLLAGHTMAVYWMPGDTAYTVEVYRQKERCA